MQFDSVTFILFLFIILALFHGLDGWKSKKIVLLLFSYLFYAAWRPPLLLLLFVSTSVDWLAARYMARSGNQLHRTTWLIVSLLVNLGLLAYFKYAAWITENLASLSVVLGWRADIPVLDIILPIGISFYTFQTLSYTIDVYRKRIEPANSLLDFALYVGFFPQLVAGPIVRAAQFLPQLNRERFIIPDRLAKGWILFIFGLFSKVVLADAVLAPVVDQVYGGKAVAFWEAWLSVFAFSGQIYFDFSGYTSCALGIALMLGFTLPENFRAPYAASGFSDFWRRWHITLSTWLRDYLYIPLGGSRHGKWRTAAALGLTMFLGGLWHGAAWNFVYWGLLHGSYLIMEHYIVSIRPSFRVILSSLTGRLFIFIVISLTWILFRSASLSQASDIFQSLWSSRVTGTLGFLESTGTAVVVISMFIWHQIIRRRSAHKIFSAWPVWVKSVCTGFALISIYIFSKGDSRAFIYFQF